MESKRKKTQNCKLTNQKNGRFRFSEKKGCKKGQMAQTITLDFDQKPMIFEKNTRNFAPEIKTPTKPD